MSNGIHYHYHYHNLQTFLYTLGNILFEKDIYCLIYLVCTGYLNEKCNTDVIE